ncbi:MAG: hypothetical protein ACYCU0_09570, partial [Solirubrobacteraceae bacterium]
SAPSVEVGTELPTYKLERLLSSAEVQKLLGGLSIGSLPGQISPEALAKALASLPALEALKVTDLEASLKKALEGLGSGTTLGLLAAPQSLVSNVVGLLDKLLSPLELLKLESLLGGESLQSKLEGALSTVQLDELLAKLTGSSSEPTALLEGLLGKLPTGTVESLLGGKLEAPAIKTTVGELAAELGLTVEELLKQLGETVAQLPETKEVLLDPLSNGELLSVLNGTNRVVLGTLGHLLGLGGGAGSEGGTGGKGGSGKGEGGSGGKGEGGGSGGSGSGGTGGAGGTSGGGTTSGGTKATGTTLIVGVPEAASAPAASTTPAAISASAAKTKAATKVTKGRIVVVKHTVHGAVASIVVQTPGAGKLFARNRRVNPVNRHVGVARRLSFKVVLSRASAKAARRGRRALRMKLRIVFKPTDGPRSHAIVQLRFR